MSNASDVLPLALAALRRYGQHTEQCDDAHRRILQMYPSSERTCVCGLDDVLSFGTELPTLADLMRYVDSDRGKADCSYMTDVHWRPGRPLDRGQWIEFLVRDYATGKLDSSFIRFLKEERDANLHHQAQ